MAKDNILEVILSKDLEAKFKSLDNWLEKIEKNTQGLSSNISKLASDFSKFSTTMTGSASGISGLNAQIQKLTASISKMGSVSSTSANQTNNSITQTSAQLNRLYNERLRYETEIAKLETQGQAKGVKTWGDTAMPKGYIEAIEKYKVILDQVESKIEEITQKYQKEGVAARQVYDAKAAAQSIRNEQQRANAIEQATKARQRQNAEDQKQRNSKYGLLGADGLKPETIEQYRLAIRNLKREMEQLSPNDKTGIAAHNKKMEEYKKILREAGVEQQRFEGTTQRLGVTMRNLAASFGIVFSLQSMMNFGRKVVEITGEFELQHRAMQAIIGDISEANKLWDKTVKLAVRSPYRVKDLVSYTKQLSAYRIESDKLYDTTKMLADISSGLGVDMQRLILAYGQVKAANYLRGQELRQFSEAGVNILGELAAYFSEMKNQAISTGDVFDMVSKRMVKFEDVANVMKRLTEEGGTFYNMQEIQAETIIGKVNNLRDRFDIMLNDIGSSQQNAITRIIDLANSVMNNWQLVGDAITMTVSALAIYQGVLLATAIATKKFAAGTIVETAALRGLTGAVAKAIVSVRSLGATLKTAFATPAGIATGIVMALIAVGWEIHRINKRQREETQKMIQQYGELKETISRQDMTGYDTFIGKIDKNNEKIKENIALLKQRNAFETEEQKKVVELETARLQSQNIELVKQLQKEYALLGDNLALSEDAIITFQNEAREMYNRKQAQTDFITGMESTAGTRNNILTVIDQYENYQNELKKAQSTFDQFAASYLNKAKLLVETNKEFMGYKDVFNEIINNETLTKLEKFEQINAKLNDTQGYSIQTYINSPQVDEAYDRIVSNNEKIEKETKKLTQGFVNSINEMVMLDPEAYNTATESGKQLIKSAIEAMTYEWRDKSPALMRLIQRIFKQKFEIEIVPQTTLPEKELRGWRKDLKKLIDDYNKGKDTDLQIPLKINADSSREELEKEFLAIEKEADEVIKRYNQKGQKVVPLEEYLKAEGVKEYMPLLKTYFGTIEKATKGGGGNPALENLNKQIEAIKNATKQYQDYQKLFDDSTAFDKTKEAVSDLFKELKISHLLKEEDIFNESGQLENLENWLSSSIAAAGNAGNVAAEKYLRNLQLGIDKGKYDKLAKDFSDNMSKALSDYDMFKELKELGIGGDISESIFGVQTKSLAQLKNVYEAEKAIILAQYKGAEAIKLVEEVDKKIAEMEDKERVERLKKYTEYLVKGRDEAVKIHLDELTKMAELDELYAKGRFTDTQYDSIAAKIRKETQEALDKNQWTNFKDTNFYTTMFEDMAHVADSSIDIMLDQLYALRNNLNDLDPTQVKEITAQINKLEEERHDRHPLKFLIKDLKTLRQWDKEGNENALAMLGLDRKSQQKAYDELSRLVAEAQAKYNELSENGIMGDEADQKLLLDDLEKRLAEVIKRLAEIDTQTQKINDDNTKGQTAWENVMKTLKNASQVYNGLVSTATEIAEVVGEMYGDSSEATKQLTEDIANLAASTGALVSDIISAIASKGTNVQAMADGILQTVNIIKRIASISKNPQNRTIEEMQDKIEQTEWDLDRIKAASDRAWDVTSMRRYRDEMLNAINDQIAAYDEMIKAEESLKNPDENLLEEWRRSRQELKTDLEETKEDMLERFGGIGADNYGDAAQGFVDAWFDAFRETGDGLEGLREHFNEIIENMVKKQAMLRVANAILDPLFKHIDRAADDGVVTAQEYEAILAEAEAKFPQLNEMLKQFAESIGYMAGETESELTGLQQGIQGVTEQTAEIIAAYLNSIRYYVIDSNTKLGQLLASMHDTTGLQNPMLAELRNIRQQTETIYDYLWQRRQNGNESMRVFVVN